MVDNKYIGAEGLKELVTLTKNELAKKSDIVQFYTMPDPTGYTGRMVQYVGTPGPEDTFKFGHFYFSISNTWQEITVQDEDPEKDIICHYKGRTTVDTLPSADRSNYSDIYRITDASVYGPPNTHVICSTVQGDGSRYEWRSLGGDINNYKTEETIIGKWVDGKPIYRRMFSRSDIIVDSNGGYTPTINALDALISSKVVAKENDYSGVTGSYIVEYGGSCKRDTKQIAVPIHMSTNSSITYNLFYMIVEYTKTTDQVQ